MARESAIQVSDVRFSYPNGVEVLKGLSCDIGHGEKVALIGPNGAGKSTFMSHLNGVAIATAGEVVIDGVAVKPENLKDIRRKVGIVFQDPDDQLFCPTVFDDVAFGPLNLGLSKDEIATRVDEALDTVGLKGFEERASHHLSFGERKRLALATVLSYQPEILVFDEPSTNMDPLNRRKLIEWLQRCEKTVLLCTHDLDIALDVCERCLVLTDGRIVADGKASEILYDRGLLEANNLELPLALMTHELLHDKLRAGQMDEEHRRIIEDFLHAHRHVHGVEHHEHVHIHAHAHDHEHLHEDGDTHHVHELAHGDGEDAHHPQVGVPHSHAGPEGHDTHSHGGHTHGTHTHGGHTHGGHTHSHEPRPKSGGTEGGGA
jgi:cobalt/nickel transport system ATP-binding protein